jgi:hypothetical protein
MVVDEDIGDLFWSIKVGDIPFDGIRNVKDLAEVCLSVIIEHGYEVGYIYGDGTFDATKTEKL